MKLGLVTKFDRRNAARTKKIDDSVMSENCDVIVVFPIYDRFGAIWKPDSEGMICKAYIFINSNLSKLKAKLKLSNFILLL